MGTCSYLIYWFRLAGLCPAGLFLFGNIPIDRNRDTLRLMGLRNRAVLVFYVQFRKSGKSLDYFLIQPLTNPVPVL